MFFKSVRNYKGAILLGGWVFLSPVPAHASSNSSALDDLQNEDSLSKTKAPKCSEFVHKVVEEFCASPQPKNPWYAGPQGEYSDTFLFNVKSFLGLLPCENAEVLNSRKGKIFNYLSSGRHTLSQVYFFDDIPEDERLEVFDCLDILEFPEFSNRADQILWLSFMPKGKRESMWPIFYAEIKTFAAKHIKGNIGILLKLPIWTHWVGSERRFHPGLFPLVDSMITRWDEKLPQNLSQTAAKKVNRARYRYMTRILPLVAEMPLDARTKIHDQLESGVIITIGDLLKILEIKQRKC